MFDGSRHRECVSVRFAVSLPPLCNRVPVSTDRTLTSSDHRSFLSGVYRRIRETESSQCSIIVDEIEEKCISEKRQKDSVCDSRRGGETRPWTEVRVCDKYFATLLSLVFSAIFFRNVSLSCVRKTAYYRETD